MCILCFQVAYNGSKAALTHMGRSLAGEWVGKGVRVNTLSPGYISTGKESAFSSMSNEYVDLIDAAFFRNVRRIRVRQGQRRNLEEAYANAPIRQASRDRRSHYLDGFT